MSDCPTCHQRIPEPRPLRDASPSDFLAARAVRAVLNELVGQEVLRSRVAELVADRLARAAATGTPASRSRSRASVALRLRMVQATPTGRRSVSRSTAASIRRDWAPRDDASAGVRFTAASIIAVSLRLYYTEVERLS